VGVKPDPCKSIWAGVGGQAVCCMRARGPRDAASRCHLSMASPPSSVMLEFTFTHFTVRVCRALGGAGTRVGWTETGLFDGWEGRARGPCCRLRIKSPSLRALLGRRALGAIGDPCCRSTGPSRRAQQGNPQSPQFVSIHSRTGLPGPPPKGWHFVHDRLLCTCKNEHPRPDFQPGKG
jgi:hypothetical protein